MYLVVHKNKVEEPIGALDFIAYRTKAGYDHWNNAERQKFYETVAEDITEEEVIDLCAASEADRAIWADKLKRASDFCESH